MSEVGYPPPITVHFVDPHMLDLCGQVAGISVDVTYSLVLSSLGSILG